MRSRACPASGRSSPSLVRREETVGHHDRVPNFFDRSVTVRRVFESDPPARSSHIIDHRVEDEDSSAMADPLDVGHHWPCGTS